MHAVSYILVISIELEDLRIGRLGLSKHPVGRLVIIPTHGRQKLATLWAEPQGIGTVEEREIREIRF